jgi:FkbM family methyltransferase
MCTAYTNAFIISHPEHLIHLFLRPYNQERKVEGTSQVNRTHVHQVCLFNNTKTSSFASDLRIHVAQATVTPRATITPAPSLLVKVTTGLYSPSFHKFDILGTTIEAAIRHSGWNSLFWDHIQREAAAYRILRDAIREDDNAFVLDIGANHGFYALYAAALGAKHVITVEPQVSLCAYIYSSLHRANVDTRVVLYNNAVLDQTKKVSLRDAEINEGAVATVTMHGGSIQAVPVTDIAPPDTRVSFLKIDVEGVEIAAMRSAFPLLRRHLVTNIVVEFGPPSRWSRVTGQDKSVRTLIGNLVFVALKCTCLTVQASNLVLQEYISVTMSTLCAST